MPRINILSSCCKKELYDGDMGRVDENTSSFFCPKCRKPCDYVSNFTTWSPQTTEERLTQLEVEMWHKHKQVTWAFGCSVLLLVLIVILAFLK